MTFRSKLIATHVAVVLVVAVGTAVGLDRSLGVDLLHELDARLEAQAEGAADWAGQGQHPARLAQRMADTVGAEVTLFDDGGQIVGRSRRAPAVPFEAPDVQTALTGEVGHGSADTADGRFRLVAVRAIGGRVLRLAAPLSGLDAVTAHLRERLIVATVIAAAFALALSLLIARVIAGPLRAMTRAAADIARGEYTTALPPGPDDELGSLSRALSALARQLSDDTERIQKLERVRRDFVANLSHEIRTPVTAIQGYSETLLRGTADEATSRRFLETMKRQAERLASLTADLLELSRLEARDDAATPLERVDVGAAIDQALAEARERAPASLTLQSDCPEGLIATGRAAELAQIFANLIENAVRYGRADGAVTVAAKREGERIVLSVRDDGPGIAPDHLPRLFERFYRVDAARSREDGGTGLGLAIVKHLAEGMGGTVRAESEPGRSATFFVELGAA